MKKIVHLTQGIKFNGGGHYNHEFFWETLCAPEDSHRPEEGTTLHSEITKVWDDWDTF